MASQRRPRFRRLAAVTVAVALSTGSAWAFWTTTTAPGSSGAAVAATVGSTGAPSATAQGRTVTVRWPATTLSSGAPVDGYRLTRYAAGDTAPLPVGVGCAGLVTSTSCTELDVPEGTWSYTVTALLGQHWRGPEGMAGNAVVVDVTAPAGGSVDVTGLGGTEGRYSTSQSLSVSFSPGTDANGIAASGAQLQRAAGTLSEGSCGAWQPYALVPGGNAPVSPVLDTVPGAQACYRYQYVAKDTSGNATTYTSPDVKVDTTAPGVPALGFGSLTSAATNTAGGVWYRPGVAGSFQVSASSNDAGSGISAHTWPSLGSGWTRTSVSDSVSRYSWSGTPADPGAKGVSATNHAGLTSPAASFTATPDGTAPTAGTISYADGVTTADTVVVTTTTGTDSQSGIVTRLLQRAVAPATDNVCGSFGAFATVVHGTDPKPTREDQVTRGSCYKYRYVVRDAVGNEHVATSSSVVQPVDSSYARAVRTTAGLAGYWRLGDSPQLRDSFGGAAGVTLQSRASEDGSTWTRHDVLSTMDAVVTSAGRVRRAGPSSNSTGAVYYSSIEPSRADYTVEADVYVASNETNDAVGVIGRYDPSGTATSYVAAYDQATQTWQLLRFTYGRRYVLAQTAPQALTPGRTYRIALDLRGTQLRMFLDGEPILSTTDAGISIGTAGFGSGFGLGGASPALTDATGMHVDNFRVSPPAADVAGSRPGTYLGTALRMLGAIANDVDAAASFDGVDDTATMTATAGTETSVELWFRAAAGSGTVSSWDSAMPLASADLAGANDFGVSLAASGQLVAGSGAGTAPVVTSASYADNAWHHLVLTRSQSTGALQLYVDGALQGSAPIALPVATGPATLRLGRGVTAAGGYLSGLLDEVAWYDVVLGEQTVAAHQLAAR